MGAEQGHEWLLKRQQRRLAEAGCFVVTGEKLGANEHRDKAQQRKTLFLYICCLC